jgi:hypothetical protein
MHVADGIASWLGRGIVARGAARTANRAPVVKASGFRPRRTRRHPG